jgi:hypothetical protein
MTVGVLVVVVLQVGSEVVRTGRLLEGVDKDIVEVRLFDSLTVYADPLSRLGGTRRGLVAADLATGALLIALAGMAAAFAAAMEVAAGAGGTRLWRFHIVVALVAVLMATDELFSVHETVGYNLRRIEEAPGQPGNLILAAYLAAAGGWAFSQRDLIRRSAAATAVLALAAVAIGAGLVADMLKLGGEESVELVAVLLLLVGYGGLALEHLRGAVEPA